MADEVDAAAAVAVTGKATAGGDKVVACIVGASVTVANSDISFLISGRAVAVAERGNEREKEENIKHGANYNHYLRVG